MRRVDSDVYGLVRKAFVARTANPFCLSIDLLPYLVEIRELDSFLVHELTPLFHLVGVCRASERKY